VPPSRLVELNRLELSSRRAEREERARRGNIDPDIAVGRRPPTCSLTFIAIH
jgi:hypothetical protein